MKSSAFLKHIASTYHVEEKTVTLYARLMKEAGLITSGARGVNAPHMHPRDAVRLTIALLATGTAAHAVKLYRRFAKMTYWPDRSEGPHHFSPEELEEATLESVLLQMFVTDYFSETKNDRWPFGLAPYLEIQENQRVATIKHSPLIDGKFQAGAAGSGLMFFGDKNRPNDVLEDDRKAHRGIHVSRGIRPMDLESCALPFWFEKRDRISYETILAEREDETIRRFRDGHFTPEKGLWFERDLEAN